MFKCNLLISYNIYFIFLSISYNIYISCTCGRKLELRDHVMIRGTAHAIILFSPSFESDRNKTLSSRNFVLSGFLCGILIIRAVGAAKARLHSVARKEAFWFFLTILYRLIFPHIWRGAYFFSPESITPI